jgi:hypothetical protein
MSRESGTGQGEAYEANVSRFDLKTVSCSVTCHDHPGNKHEIGNIHERQQPAYMADRQTCASWSSCSSWPWAAMRF